MLLRLVLLKTRTFAQAGVLSVGVVERLAHFYAGNPGKKDSTVSTCAEGMHRGKLADRMF